MYINTIFFFIYALLMHMIPYNITNVDGAVKRQAFFPNKLRQNQGKSQPFVATFCTVRSFWSHFIKLKVIFICFVPQTYINICTYGPYLKAIHTYLYIVDVHIYVDTYVLRFYFVISQRIAWLKIVFPVQTYILNKCF